MAATITASQIVKKLKSLSSAKEAAHVKHFFRGNDDGSAPDNKILGVRIGKVFAVAKEFIPTQLAEIEKLLESPYYEVRMAAVSIMDFQARAKATTPSQRKALCDLYLKRHDRINHWDLVDRAAPHVVGRYLMDQRRDVLVRLASTYAFLRAGDVKDTVRIAELLVDDEHELVQKATGFWLREAGKKKELA